MYGVVGDETVVVGISDTRERGQILGISYPIRRENNEGLFHALRLVRKGFSLLF